MVVDMEPEDRARFDSLESINSVMALLLGLVVGLSLGLLWGQYLGLFSLLGLVLVMVPSAPLFLSLGVLLFLLDKVLKLIKSEPFETVFSPYWLDRHPDLFIESAEKIHRAKETNEGISLEREIFFSVFDISFAITIIEVDGVLNKLGIPLSLSSLFSI
jgi:hypothetical protein